MGSSEAQETTARDHREAKSRRAPWARSSTVRALRHRNYRLFMSGQVVSLMGTWMQTTAQSWLVYNVLAPDPFLLGLTNFASQVPILALGLFGGLAADLVDRHRLVTLTQVLLMLQSCVLAALTLMTGSDGRPLVTMTDVLLLAAFAGAVQAFDMPTRQAFIIQIVPKEDFNNAIALNSLSFNAARVIGPSLAAVVMAGFQRLWPERKAFGEGMCFLLNAASFLAVIVALARMDRHELRSGRQTSGGEISLTSGLRYLERRRHLVYLIVAAGAVSFFSLPYLVIIPAVARDILDGDATVYGWLMTSVGIGAIIGGIRQARRQHIRGLGRLIVWALAGFSAVLIAMAFVRETALMCLGFVAAGFFMVNAMISAQVLVQALVAEHYRGRVMSYYTMMTVGTMPFGSLVVGAEAKHFGTPASLAIIGATTGIITVGFALALPTIRQAARSSPEYADLLGRLS